MGDTHPDVTGVRSPRASTRGIGAVVLVMCVAGAMAWGQVSGHDAHTKHTTGSRNPTTPKECTHGERE